MDLVAAVRQEGTEHRRAVADRLGKNMQDRSEPLTLIVGLELERRLVGDVLVDLGHDPHDLADRLLLPVPLDQGANGRETLVDGRQEDLVVGVQLGCHGDLAKAAVDHRGRAVHQVAPARDQLTVGALDELGPGEVAVLVLRTGRRDEVAQGVGLIALEDVADVDHDATTGRELLALHGEELGAHHLGRELQDTIRSGLAALVAQAVIGQQLGWPDLGVEGDVVLAHEVVGQGLRVVPPVAPCLGVARPAGPLDRCRQIADDGVEPDIEPLGLITPAVQRDRDAPVDVARHGPRPDVLEDVLAELDDVGAPGARRLALVEPLTERLRQRRQVEEEVLGLDELRGLAVDLAVWVQQLGRVELVAAVVALVATGLGVAADRARSLDVAVRQRAAGRRADRTTGGLLDHVAVGVDRREHLLRHRVVVRGRRTGEQVVGQPQAGEVLHDDAVVLVRQLLGSHPLLVGRHQDRGAVLVGAAYHQDVVAGHPHVAAEDVGRHAKSGHVADMTRTVCVRPGDSRQDLAHGLNPKGRPRVVFPMQGFGHGPCPRVPCCCRDRGQCL